MNKINRFNLIDEPWIPIVDVGCVSLRQLFSHFDYNALGGNPIEKIALMKLLLAIAQSACTPLDDNDWEELGVNGLSEKCLAYLERMYDLFWLYGEKPFLQMPQIACAKTKTFGAVLPEVATGNTTVLNEMQVEKSLCDAEKTLLVLSLMGCALGGKKTDNTVVLSEGYQGKQNMKGKEASGSPGSFLGTFGLMHSFILSDSLLKTIFSNLVTKACLEEKLTFYSEGLGIAPWEKMPEGEECPTAISLINSLMGRLVPLSRFCLLTEKSLHYSEGIRYPNHKEGGVDPSITSNFSGEKSKALWVDPEKRPWRHLTAQLSFMTQSTTKDRRDCYQIQLCLGRARKISVDRLGIWSGGLKISSNAGEQYVSGMDDFVDSTILLPVEHLGKSWYEQLKLEMEILDELSKILYSSVVKYFKNLKVEGTKTAKASCNLFWQLCERHSRNLLIACKSPEEAKAMRKRVFISCINKVYDQFCHKNTARQLDSWSNNRPNLKKYFIE